MRGEYWQQVKPIGSRDLHASYMFHIQFKLPWDRHACVQAWLYTNHACVQLHTQTQTYADLSFFFLVKGSNSSNMQKLQTKHKHLKFIKYILNLLSKPHGLILATQQTQLKKNENNLIKLTSIKAATTHTHICGDVVHSLGKRRLKK